MKTISLNVNTVDKKWVVVDAADQVLGRIATKVAAIIRGKTKPTFTPHVDCGDNVIIINASKVIDNSCRAIAFSCFGFIRPVFNFRYGGFETIMSKG